MKKIGNILKKKKRRHEKNARAIKYLVMNKSFILLGNRLEKEKR